MSAFQIGRARLEQLATWIRGSLWPVPSVMTLGAAVLAFVMVSVDMRLADDLVDADLWFLFGVGPDGVRGVLSALASSIITVTGVVFSITIVALQLASSQYSPRVLRTFLEDRSTQLVLGVFIGTFTYALLILRTVRAEGSRLPEFVPSLSVTVAMLLGLASVASLIFFVNHIAQSIRASVIVKHLTTDAVAIARRAFPREVGEPERDVAEPQDDARGNWTPVRVLRPGYLNDVTERVLFSLPGTTPLVVRMRARIGDFLRSGDTVADLATADVAEDLEARARDAFVLGAEALGPTDTRLGVTRLTEVALRALSSSINDIGTASVCLDGISEVLVIAGTRNPPAAVRASKDGRVRLIAQYPGFGELVETALAPIRQYGAESPVIMGKLLEVLRAVGIRMSPERRKVMADQITLALRTVEQRVPGDYERSRLREQAESALAALV